MHYCEALNMQTEGKAAYEIAKHFGFETLEQMFTAVANQAEEDFEIKAFG